MEHENLKQQVLHPLITVLSLLLNRPGQDIHKNSESEQSLQSSM